MSVQQRTLQRATTCVGIGLHSGAAVTLTLRPAAPSTGIRFVRTDVAPGTGEIPAHWRAVADTRMCTVIANEHGVSVGTVEHLMAALAGCGVDNVIAELDGPEVPIMDGSSAPFCDVIADVGLIDQAQHRRVIRVLRTVEIEDHGRTAALAPAGHMALDVEIDFNDRVIARQAYSMGLVNGAFCKEVMSARTFGFLQEVEQLRAAGLARGGSLDNAIVVDDGKVLNDGGLRFDDEFVRHKVLDAIGDLYLAGAPIIGKFTGFKSGHEMHNKILAELFATPDAWTFDVLADDEVPFAVDGDIRSVA